MDWNKAVFLAYAKEDKIQVQKIYNELLDIGITPWFDEESLTPGAKWEDRIKEAISNCKFFLAFFSKRSIGKTGYIQKELKLALKELEKKPPGNTYFIPVLLENIELPKITVGTINLGDFNASRIFEKKKKKKLYEYLAHSITQENIQVPVPKLVSITDFLLQGEVEKALERLIMEVKEINSSYTNNVVLLMSQYKRLKVDYISNIINSDDYNMNLNKISFSVLEIIDLIEKEL